MIRSKQWMLVLVVGLGIASADAAEPPYDLVIRDGRIVDGSGNPWFHGDVAIRGERIVAVGNVPAVAAKREIDARGLVVAPGFIDMHSHSDFLLLEDGSAQSKIRQGVTTEVLGEGASAGPYKGKLAPTRAVVRGEAVRWETIGGYLDALEKSGIAVNVATYVGMDNVWQCVMGESHERPTAAQFAEMKKLLDEAMSDGAFGMSTMLAMPPGALATTDDLVELSKVVARHRGIYSTHNRHEGERVFDAIKEAIAIGERAGVPVDIIHLKIADQKYWRRMSEIIALIEGARKRGVNVQANVYPYTRGNNNLASIIPPWAHEGGTARMLERLKDPGQRDRLKKDIREGIPGWYNHYTAIGGDWSRMLISGKGSYEGLTMDRVLANRKKGKDARSDDLDLLFDILIEEGGSIPTVYAHHTEEDMRLALVQPWCSVGSDGSAYAVEGPLRRGNPHPRNFGTFPRVLGVYVREAKVLRLEDAVRKMTSLNAAKIGIVDRGLLRAGYFADVTLFDPERVIDKSTYTEPFRYNDGIEYVIVNGQVVLDRDKHTGARPGKALRHGPARSSKNPPPAVIGHRGLIHHAPENTLAAFQACLSLRLGFELDVRRSTDAELVCLHDETVNRTTNGSGKVADITFDELKKLDAGSKFGQSFAGERVPALADVLAAARQRQSPDSVIALDLKIDDDRLAQDLASLLRKQQIRHVVCIGLAIENAELRRRLRTADPQLPVAVLAQSADKLAAAIADRDSDWVYLRFIPTAEQVGLCHAAKKRVLLVGPLVMGNEPENWRKAHAAGVDAILTDYPLECRRAFVPER